MKLIGKTQDGWICSASDDEVAQLAGYGSMYHMNDQSRSGNKPGVGTLININKLYESAVTTLASYKEMKEAFAKTQKVVAKLLSMMVPEPAEEKK